MVPIPPPPDFEPAQPPPPPPPGPHEAMTYPRPGELTIGWRWVLTLGWISVVVGLFAVADAALALHKPPFWVGHGAVIAVPFVLPILTTAAAFANHRFTLWFAGAAVIALAVIALVDLRETPGVAAATAVLALIGLLTSVASIAGRMPSPEE